MARAPKVEIEGNEITNVLEVKYGVSAALDRDGAPTRGLNCDGILIRRVADDATDVCDWAASADEANRRAGKVTFQDANGLEMKSMEWEGGYVREYNVDYVEDGDHVEETFVIEAEIFGVNGETKNFNWKDK